MQGSHHSDDENDRKHNEGEACTGSAIGMATLKYSEIGQSCHDVHEGSVCGEEQGGGGRIKEGGQGGRGRRHVVKRQNITVTGYTLHMNTAPAAYTLKGSLTDLPNWKVAWLGHTW